MHIRQEDLVREFARRTRANLETLETLQRERKDVEVYEVTQLINSMLGLLVFPREKFIKEIPETPLMALENYGWPIPQVEGHFQQVKTLRQLVGYLRHAIAHCNLEFLSDDGKQITGIRVWNKDPNTEIEIWRARLTLEDIRKITDKFIVILTENSTP